MILDKSIPTSRVSTQGRRLEELRQELEMGLCLRLGLRLRVAMRLWLRLARKAEGESEDNWGCCRGWRLVDPPEGSGSAEGDGVDGSRDSRGRAAAQGAWSYCCCCCCCWSRRRCRQVLSGLRHRGRCSRRPARPAARSKGAERACRGRALAGGDGAGPLPEA